jgi:hypothetical protein
MNSPAIVLQGKGPAQGRRLAPHHRIKVWSASLYRVPEDSVCSSASQRLSRVLVGIIHRRAAFRGHHLLTGTMRHKLAEFLDLHQVNRSVYEYTQEFNNLAQYRGHHVDTDAKKAELFRKGLTI